MHRVTLIPGDDIGPEVTAAARAVVEASGAGVEFEPCCRASTPSTGIKAFTQAIVDKLKGTNRVANAGTS